MSHVRAVPLTNISLVIGRVFFLMFHSRQENLPLIGQLKLTQGNGVHFIALLPNDPTVRLLSLVPHTYLTWAFIGPQVE